MSVNFEGNKGMQTLGENFSRRFSFECGAEGWEWVRHDRNYRGRFSWTRNSKGDVLEGNKPLPSSRSKKEARIVRAS